MDRETQEEFLVVIQAKDMGGHMGGLSGSTTVTVTLSDVNDNPPKFPQSKSSSLPKQSFDGPTPRFSETPSLPNPFPCKKDMLGESGRAGDPSKDTPSLLVPLRSIPVLCGGDSWTWNPGGPA